MRQPRWLDEVLCIFPFVFATYRQRQEAGKKRAPPPPHVLPPSLTPFPDDCIKFSASFSLFFSINDYTEKHSPILWVKKKFLNLISGIVELFRNICDP